MKISNYHYNEGQGLSVEVDTGTEYLFYTLDFSTIKEWAKESRVLEHTYDWVDVRGEHRQSQTFDFKPEQFNDMLEAYVSNLMADSECNELMTWAIKNNKI